MSRKKNKWPQIIFFAIVVGLVAFSLFDYKKMKREEGLGEGEQKLLTLTTGEVVEIDYKSKKQTVQLKNESGVWKVLQPLQDEADDVGVVSVLNALKDAKVHQISEGGKENGKDIDWAQYGLNPGISMEITTDEGKKDAFRISDTNAYDGSYYIERGGDLFTTDKTIAHLADLQVAGVRSHNPWRQQGEVIKIEAQYSYEGSPRHVTLTKGEKGWSAQPAFDLPVSAERVKDWLQALRDVRFNDFAADNSDEKSLEKFGLRNPSQKYIFTAKMDGKETSVTWKFSQEKDVQVFLNTSLRPDIYRGTRFTWRETRIPIEQLLDTKDVLQFELEQANDIELTNDGKRLHFVKGDKEWEVKDQGAEAGKFHSVALVDFFQKLKGLEPQAGEMPSELSFDSKNHLVVKGNNGPVLDLSWTNTKDQLRWLKISKFKERFKVSAERFNAFLKTEFLSKSEAKP
jgi:hypothetical protein